MDNCRNSQTLSGLGKLRYIIRDICIELESKHSQSCVLTYDTIAAVASVRCRALVVVLTLTRGHANRIVVVHLAVLVDRTLVGVLARIHAALIDARTLCGTVDVRAAANFYASLEQRK